MRKLLLIAALAVPAASCADLNPTQQRALTGTVGGAGIGAVAGAIGGNAGLGAVVGAGPDWPVASSGISTDEPRTAPFNRAMPPHDGAARPRRRSGEIILISSGEFPTMRSAS